MVGIGAALLLARIDRRVRTRGQAEAIFGLQSQVAVPYVSKKANKPIVVVPGRHDSLSDAYRTLRNVVGFIEGGVAAGEHRGLVALVVSPGPGDGKTSVSTNLAAAFAESGLSTVAVNTDFRRPSLSERLLGERPIPLPASATAAAWLPLEDLLRQGPLEDLTIFDLAGIDASPGQLARITSGRVRELSASVGAVVIDTSPVGATAEVLELVPHADVIVIVVRLDSTSVEAATRTIEILRVLTEAHLLLVIVGESRERSKYYDEYSAPAPKPARVGQPSTG
jgi:Mrp family chromosome partitioning ATPase